MFVQHYPEITPLVTQVHMMILQILSFSDAAVSWLDMMLIDMCRVYLICEKVDDLNKGFGLRSSVRSLRGSAIFI